MSDHRLEALVVEDDPDHGLLIRRTLERQERSIGVTLVPDGPACLEALKAREWSVILLDYSLPRMTGLEVLAEIRRRGATVPVVIVTGQGDERVAVDAMKAGATDYVMKTPGYLATLPTVISKVLQQHALMQENVRLYEEAQCALRDLKAAQVQLVRGETMRALGELAGGAAHHLNNLFAVICGRMELVLGHPESEPLRGALETVARAATDGAEVVRRIQEFALTTPTMLREAVDLNQVAEEVRALMRHRWPDTVGGERPVVEIVLEPGDIPTIPGHTAPLREVVTNLVVNAVEAMPPEGGRIVIKTWAVAGMVLLMVKDNGEGMSEEILRQAQEPFFTTKGPKSTGLGLSVNYGIVRRYDGTTLIESDPASGTTVTIAFHAEGAPAPPATPVPLAEAEATALRVLIVDDEPDVLDLVAEFVETQGHTAVPLAGPPAPDAWEAIAIAPDVVITDIGMSGTTGWDVAAAARSRWPKARIGLMTGWGDTITPPTPEAGHVDFVLSKPLTLSSLREALTQTVS